MAYGELITELHANLATLDRDLNTARQKLKRFYDDAAKMSVSLRGGGTGRTTGGTGPGGVPGPTDSHFRYIEAQRVAAERQQRQFNAARQAADRQNQRIEEQALTQRMGQLRAANTQRQAFATEERKTIEANRKARADAEKEFAQIGRQAIQQGGQMALRQAKAQEKERTEQIKLSAAAAKQLNRHYDEAKEKLAGIIGSTKDLAKLMIGAGSLSLVGGAVLFAKAALDIDRFYEKSKITIAEVLALTTSLKDAQGHIVTGVREQNANYAESTKLIEMIRQASIRTALDAKSLVGIFSQGLGFATSAGASPEKAVPLISQIANLGRALGAESQQAQSTEVRALLSGQFIARSRVGRVLGLSKADIEEHRKAGDLIQFLTERLKAGQPYLDRWAKSWDGITTTIQTRFQSFLHLSTEKTFDKLRTEMSDLNKAFSEKTLTDWAEKLSEVLAQAGERLSTLAHLPIWGQLQRNFGFLLFDQGEATDRETAAMRGRRGPQRSALELARLSRRGAERDLSAAQDAARSRAFGRSQQAGFGPLMVNRFVSPEDERSIEVQTRLLARARQREAAAEDAVTRQHIANQLKRGQATGDQLRREAKVREESKQSELKTQIEIERILKSTRDQKADELRDEARANILKVQKDIGNEKTRANLIRAIREHLNTQLNDLDKEANNNYFKALAEATGNKRLALYAEHQAKLKEIADGDYTEAQSRKLNLAEDKSYHQKQVQLLREFRDQAMSLAHQEFDLKAEMHRAEVNQIKELQKYRKEGADEQRNFTREQAEAEQAIRRSEIDRALAAKRLFDTPRVRPSITTSRSGRTEFVAMHGGTPGQVGIADEQESIRKEAMDLFGDPRLRQQLAQQFRQQGMGGDLAEAQTERQLRDFAQRAQQPGGSAEVLGQLQAAGVSVPFGFQKQLQGLDTRATRLQGRQEDLQHEGEQEQLRREREDAFKPAEDAQKQLDNLQEKRIQFEQDHQTALNKIYDDQDKQTADFTDRLRKLGEEASKFAKTLHDSHVLLAADLRPLLAPLMNMTPQGAKASVASVMAPVYNFHFGPNSVQMTSKGDLPKEFLQLMEREARISAPPRK